MKSYGNGTKKCSKCREIKPLGDFSNDSGRPDGKDPQCKVCKRRYYDSIREKALPKAAEYRKANKDKIDAYLRKWRDENREYINSKQKDYYKLHRDEAMAYRRLLSTKERDRDNRLRDWYGIGLLEYNAILESQSGVCAICGGVNTGKRKNLFVDHDHKTGTVRGLLCDNCNRAIGHIKDSPNFALKMYEYLISFVNR